MATALERYKQQVAAQKAKQDTQAPVTNTGELTWQQKLAQQNQHIINQQASNTAPQPILTPSTSTGGTQTKPLEFTPKQVETMLSKYGSKQALYDDVIKRGMESGADGGALLNALNVAFEGVNIPSRVDGGATGVRIPTEGQNQYTAMQNDFASLFNPNEEITQRINDFLPGIGTAVNQAGQVGYDVGQEYINNLNTRLREYQDMFGEGGQARRDLDEMLRAQEASLQAERDSMDTVYNLENAGISANAFASGASGGQVAAQRARLRGEEAQRRAQYQTKVAQLAETKRNSLLDMYNQLENYKDQYLQNYSNSRDKYVVDNYRNMVQIQADLLAQIKEWEIRQRELGLTAAQSTAAANAAGGLPVGGTGAGGTGTGGVTNTGNNLSVPNSLLRSSVEPRNPELFRQLPPETQQQLIQEYGNENEAINRLNVTSQVNNPLNVPNSPSMGVAPINTQVLSANEQRLQQLTSELESLPETMVNFSRREAIKREIQGIGNQAGGPTIGQSLWNAVLNGGRNGLIWFFNKATEGTRYNSLVQ